MKRLTKPQNEQIVAIMRSWLIDTEAMVTVKAYTERMIERFEKGEYTEDDAKLAMYFSGMVIGYEVDGRKERALFNAFKVLSKDPYWYNAFCDDDEKNIETDYITAVSELADKEALPGWYVIKEVTWDFSNDVGIREDLVLAKQAQEWGYELVLDKEFTTAYPYDYISFRKGGSMAIWKTGAGWVRAIKAGGSYTFHKCYPNLNQALQDNLN